MRIILLFLALPLLGLSQSNIDDLLEGTGFNYGNVDLTEDLSVEFIQSEYRPSKKEAQLAIDEWYEKWRDVTANPENWNPSEGDTNRAWLGFNEETKDELLSLEIPLLLAYGTKDTVSRSYDWLPLDFIRAGKTNLTLRPYLGCEHNFEKTLEDGTSENLFRKVITESLDWVATEQ